MNSILCFSVAKLWFSATTSPQIVRYGRYRTGIISCKIQLSAFCSERFIIVAQGGMLFTSPQSNLRRVHVMLVRVGGSPLFSNLLDEKHDPEIKQEENRTTSANTFLLGFTSGGINHHALDCGTQHQDPGRALEGAQTICRGMAWAHDSAVLRCMNNYASPGTFAVALAAAVQVLHVVSYYFMASTV